jgi:transcriptional regulator of arginine metabolism
MVAKDDRQAAILDLVTSGTVHTQRDLLKALKSRRIAVDQSTLSRDLSELNVRKSGGTYILNGPNRPAPTAPDFAAAVLRFTTCGPHLIVVRTGVGQAQPVALRIEDAGEPAVTATLAGDDTIFVATKSSRAQVVALRRLKEWFGDKHEP